MQLAEFLPKFAKKHRIIEVLCRMGLQNKISKAKFNGNSSVFIDLMDPEPRNVFIRGEFEAHFFEIAKFFLPDQGVFFDLGANVGFCSFGMLPSNPNCHYHLFEANPKMIELLWHSINYHNKCSIKLTHACVTEKHGVTEFCLSNEQSGQSHVATIEEHGIKIPNISLDNYCFENNISKIDFAKIDLEGHELSALKGWNQFLARGMVKTIYLEVMPENQARYGLNTNEPLLYLESQGYDLFLCKNEDFNIFQDSNDLIKILTNNVRVLPFKANEYPLDFTTDILAISSDHNHTQN